MVVAAKLKRQAVSAKPVVADNREEMFGFRAVSDHEAAINPLIHLLLDGQCLFGESCHGFMCPKKNPPICAYLKKQAEAWQVC